MVFVNANATVVLPAQVEVDVFGDDESSGRPVAVLVARVDLVAFLAGFFADEAGCVVAEKGFDGEEAAADNDEVGFNDTDFESAWMSLSCQWGGGRAGMNVS